MEGLMIMMHSAYRLLASFSCLAKSGSVAKALTVRGANNVQGNFVHV